MKKCFIISPIGSEGSDIRKRSDQLLKHVIEPVCSSNQFEAVRVDRIHSSDSINQDIINHLEDAELVIADITDHNPNCFYEIGYRTALKKPLIQMKHADTAIPFDIHSIRTIDYVLNDPDKLEECKEKLDKVIKNFSFSSNPNTADSVFDDSKALLYIRHELRGIQNMIASLFDRLDSYDQKILSVVISQLKEPSPSPEDKMISPLFSSLIENPDKIDQFMALAEKMQKIPPNQ